MEGGKKGSISDLESNPVRREHPVVDVTLHPMLYRRHTKGANGDGMEIS